MERKSREKVNLRIRPRLLRLFDSNIHTHCELHFSKISLSRDLPGSIAFWTAFIVNLARAIRRVEVAGEHGRRRLPTF